MRTFAILSVSCWSGFMLMSLELLSGRILAPTFGSSIYVWGAIITVYMLALSIGYLIGGRLSLTTPRLAVLCALHALSGLLIVPIVIFEEPVLESIFDFTQDPRAGSLIASVILFFLPAIACGTVAPYAVRLLVKDPARAGFYAGLQYFFSTAFSAAGTLLTSFYFVLILEVNQILFLLIGITLVVAGLTFATARRSAA
jgi:hypothetical protein